MKTFALYAAPFKEVRLAGCFCPDLLPARECPSQSQPAKSMHCPELELHPLVPGLVLDAFGTAFLFYFSLFTGALPGQ
jgi:hypothetical protein